MTVTAFAALTSSGVRAAAPARGAVGASIAQAVRRRVAATSGRRRVVGMAGEVGVGCPGGITGRRYRRRGRRAMARHPAAVAALAFPA